MRSDPSNADWQRDLSVSLNKVGDVQAAQADRAARSRPYRDSLAIIERLAKSDPGNAGWQRDLSVSSQNVGDARLRRGILPARSRHTATAWPSESGWQNPTPATPIGSATLS